MITFKFYFKFKCLMIKKQIIKMMQNSDEKYNKNKKEKSYGICCGLLAKFDRLSEALDLICSKGALW